MSNKRTRFESITSDKVNQKKRKETPDDEENLSEQQSNEKPGSTHLSISRSLNNYSLYRIGTMSHLFG